MRRTFLILADGPLVRREMRLWYPEEFDPFTVKQLGSMAVVRKPKHMSERSAILRFTTPPSRLNRKYALGFVPTMGALHDAHMALVEASQAECVFTAVSIYVNPKQFGTNEDLSKYPRTLKRDLQILAEAQVDVAFVPSSEDMYPPGFKMYADYEGIENRLEAQSRHGHFRGVSTVCLKLFNIVNPSTVYCGQKDAMQCLVLKSLINDFNLNTKLTVCPIVREIDGLAMSSRNVYLSPEHRAEAPAIYQSLSEVNRYYCDLMRTDKRKLALELPTAEQIKQMLLTALNSRLKSGTIDYISIGSEDDMLELQDETEVLPGSFVSVVVRFGATRLLDAIRIGHSEEEYWHPC
ncbi:Pantothenate synthetase (panC) [Diplonema papillatum]|nr:Pantothenate synthetase (panC) [Diplonema papillatum]